jgi:hypothetical protein
MTGCIWQKKTIKGFYSGFNLHEHITISSGNTGQYQMLVLRILKMWLFSRHHRDIVKQIPRDPAWQSTVIFCCYCTFLWNSSVFVARWHTPIVFKFELDGRVVVTNIGYELSSLPRGRSSKKWVLFCVLKFYKTASLWRRKLILIFNNISSEERMRARLTAARFRTY